MTTQQSQAVFPRFFIKAVHNPVESEKQNRPIYADVEFVEIRVAGDSKTVISRKVRDEDKERWPEQYKQFKANVENQLVGTPLKEWSQLTASQIAEMNAINIFTVEQLSEVSDGNLFALGTGGRELRKKAEEFLNITANHGDLSKLLEKIASLEADNVALRQQMAEIAGGESGRAA